MKQWILGLLFVLIYCNAVLALDNIAIVKNTKGVVTVKRAGEIHLIKPGDQLHKGDILMTGDNSRVGMIFDDGSILSLEEKSFLRIKDFLFIPIESKFKFKLYLKKGTALFESGKIGTLSPEDFSFEIPEGTIGIRGTKFLIEVK